MDDDTIAEDPSEYEESGKRNRKRDSYLRRKASESAANKSHRYSIPSHFSLLSLSAELII